MEKRASYQKVKEMSQTSLDDINMDCNEKKLTRQMRRKISGSPTPYV